jgi:hypothetical protein
MLFDAALTAWATLGLAVLAIVAAIFAFLAWKAQGKQIETLRQQLAGQKELNDKQMPVLEGQQAELEASRRQREHEEQERREASVSRVFIWQEFRIGGNLGRAQIASGAVPGQESQICIRNAADVPVYDVTFVWRITGQVVSLEKLDVPLMPGPEPAAKSWAVTVGAELKSIEIAVFIRDVNGNRWRILPDGRHAPYEDGMLPAGVW